MKKLLLLAAAGAGYIFGAKAGRQRYDQIMGNVNKVKNDPRVQQKTQQVVDTAKEQAPVVKDKLSSAASTAASKVSGSSDSGASVDDLNPDSTARQDNPYPQGDLP